MKKTILSLFLLTIIISCSVSEDKSSIRKIDIVEALQHPEELDLSHLGKNIKIVPIETNEKCLIGNNMNLQIGKEFVFVGSNGTPIRCFSKKDGKLIGTIGNIGKGPGEYPRYCVSSFRVDETARRVYVWPGGNRYLVYSFDGTFQKELLIENDLTSRVPFSIWSSRIKDNRIYSHNKTACFDSPFQYVSYDVVKHIFTDSIAATGTLFPCKRESASTAFYAANYGGPFYAYTYTDDLIGLVPGPDHTLWLTQNDIRIKDVYNDTIFTVNGNMLNPYAVFKLGKYTPDYARKILSPDEWKNRILVSCVYETPEIIYFHFQTGNLFAEKDQTHYCGIYQKSTGKTSVMKETDFGDKSNHLPALQIAGRTDAGELYAVVYPDKLIEWIENNPNIQAEKWMKKIKEDDNPILVLIK